MSNDQPHKTKLALVTGATGNLGQSVVHKFIGQGYRVVGTVIPNDATPFYFTPDYFEKVVVNLTDETATQLFIENIISNYETIDVVILTVGGFAMGDIMETKTADIAKQYKLNFETAYNVARPVFKQMLLQKNGRIFLFGSWPGIDTKKGKGMVAYSLAKSLIFRMAELMNEEAKGTNVVTSVVVPSMIDTPLNRNAMSTATFGDWVTTDTIADVISFYCSEAASALREPVIKIYNKG